MRIRCITGTITCSFIQKSQEGMKLKVLMTSIRENTSQWYCWSTISCICWFVNKHLQVIPLSTRILGNYLSLSPHWIGFAGNSATSKTDNRADVDKLVYGSPPSTWPAWPPYRIIIQYPGPSLSFPPCWPPFLLCPEHHKTRTRGPLGKLGENGPLAQLACLKLGIHVRNKSSWSTCSIMVLFKIQILIVCVSDCDPLLCHEWCACNKNIPKIEPLRMRLYVTAWSWINYVTY